MNNTKYSGPGVICSCLLLFILPILMICYGVKYESLNSKIKDYTNNIYTTCYVDDCKYFGSIERTEDRKIAGKIKTKKYTVYRVACDLRTIYLDNNFTNSDIVVSELKDPLLVDNNILYFNNTIQNCYLLNNKTLSYKNPNDINLTRTIKQKHKTLNNLIIVCSFFGFMILFLYCIFFCIPILTKINPNNNNIPLKQINTNV